MSFLKNLYRLLVFFTVIFAGGPKGLKLLSKKCACYLRKYTVLINEL